MVSRRKFLQAGAAGGAVALTPAVLMPKQALAQAVASACNPGPVVPIDGREQFKAIKFKNVLPNPLDPSNVYTASGTNALGQSKYTLEIKQITQSLGLVNPTCGTPINSTVWAYGTPTQAPVYPGRTFVAFQNRLGFSAYEVTYNNKLVNAQG